MGSSIGLAHGYRMAKDNKENFVAMIGDGGFLGNWYWWTYEPYF
jgi:TPP-dependent indolepyruvate ferredoxin oxidoreductase alpha subunit